MTGHHRRELQSSVPAWLTRASSRRTPAEQDRTDRDAGDSSYSGQLAIDRERRQEREHDQHCANNDQGRGHGMSLYALAKKCPLRLLGLNRVDAPRGPSLSPKGDLAPMVPTIVRDLDAVW